MVMQALVVQLGAKECLATPEPSNPDAVKMYKLLERSGMMVTDRKKGACVTIVHRRYDGSSAMVLCIESACPRCVTEMRTRGT
jgi:hypothetical protein